MYISGPGELPHVNNLSEKVFYRLDVILILFSFHFTAHSLLIAKVEKLDNKSFYKILFQILFILHKLPLHATLRLSLLLYTYTRLPLPDLREVHCLNVNVPRPLYAMLFYSLCLFLLLILLNCMHLQ